VRIPTRKKEEERRALQANEPLYLTKEKIERLKMDLERVKKDRPAAIQEVQRTGEMGDFSENAEYQLAKSKLRRINNRIVSIEERLKVVIEIQEGSPDGIVSIGSTVTVEMGGTDRTFTIVGPEESDPLRGRISYKSPLGSKLMSRTKGEKVEFNGKQISVKKL